jgi:hypothetical protein
MRTPTVRTEPLCAFVVTRDELIVIREAITRYISWLAGVPAGAVEHRDSIALLRGLHQRITQIL